MKKIMMVVMAAVAVANVALARDVKNVGKDEGEAFNSFLQSYYREPDVTKAIGYISFAETMVKKKMTTATPIAGFYFGASKTAPMHKAEWQVAKDKAKSKWLVKAIDDGLARKALEDVMPGNANNIGPDALDFIWGYFFATGDKEAPRRIIKRGAVKFPEDAAIDITAKAAQWSTFAIAKDHPIVREELEMFAKRASVAELRNFFGGEVPDHVKAYLSGEAVKKIEGLGR